MRDNKRVCAKCGAPLSEGQSFCVTCGNEIAADFKNNPTIEQYNKELEDIKKTKKKKRDKMIVCVLAVVIVVPSIIWGSILLKTQFALNKIESTHDKFVSENISFEDAKIILESYKSNEKIEIVDTAIASLKQVTNLNNSRNAYNAGISYQESKGFEDAIKSFMKVIEEDVKFEDAQTRMVECTEMFKEEVMGNIDALVAKNEYTKALNSLNTLKKYCYDSDVIIKSTSVTVDKEMYDAEQELIQIREYKDNQQLVVTKAYAYNHGNYYISRRGTIIVNNTTNNVVKDFNATILQFDSNGYPVQVEYSMYGYNNQFNVKAESANIQAGANYGYNRYYNLPDDCKKIKACVRRVEYYDGTIWTNSYFEYWLAQEKDRY